MGVLGLWVLALVWLRMDFSVSFYSVDEVWYFFSDIINRSI